jgi:hypothetical protein
VDLDAFVRDGYVALAGEPFAAAYLAPALTAAYDELIGPARRERSVRPADLGETAVVRFPAEDERANAGYHIEGSYAAPDGSGAGWVNIRSRARGLIGAGVSMASSLSTGRRCWPRSR